MVIYLYDYTRIITKIGSSTSNFLFYFKVNIFYYYKVTVVKSYNIVYINTNIKKCINKN